MFNNLDNNNVNIITTSKSNKKQRKIYCVICYPKIQLNLVNEEECRWRCPRCKNDYQILEDNNSGGDHYQKKMSSCQVMTMMMKVLVC